MTGIIAQNVGRTSGLIKAASGGGGAWTKIKTLTASDDSDLSFVDGTDDASLQFNLSVDTGSNYNVTKTTTAFGAAHKEDGTGGALSYDTGLDLAQGTGFQGLNLGSSDNDHAISGTLNIFNPSSTTFVKHFIAVSSTTNYDNINLVKYVAGYGNTTSAVDAVQFKMSADAIDAGDICLYGISS